MTNEEHKQLCEKIIRRDKTTSRVLMFATALVVCTLCLRVVAYFWG